MTTDLVHRLQSLADSSASNDGNRLMARYLLQRLSDLDSLSVQAIADACYTSIATVSRFVRSLGYDSFAKLRQAAARNIGITGFPAQLGEDGFSGLWLYTNEISSAMRRCAETLNQNEVDKLVELLLECRTAALFGIYQPGLIARHLQFLLLSTGRYTEYYDLMEDHAERAKTMGSGDLAVIFSVDGNYFSCFQDIISLMEQRGVRLVLVTQNRRLADSYSFEQIIFLGDQDSAAAGCYKLQLFTEVLFGRYLAVQRARET
ncbi:MAG: MurR/RpiR family transcriptional regulator [Oscillospiraceae bacterium]|nr:MurR/RpiR family transcriptional regulator [Oscillospiraceae bacterium]